MRALLSLLCSVIFIATATAQPRPAVYADILVDITAETAWQDWTSAKGLESFFTPKAIIDLRPGGAYEAWFLPDAAKGQRGAEDGIILGFQDGRMIHFTWAMPPYMPDIRPHMTTVQIFFDPVSDSQTRVRLYHTGFGDTPEWEKGQAYFEKVWPEVLKGYKASKMPKTEDDKD